MNCILGAFLTVVFIYIVCYLLYFSICFYNCYKKYHCYTTYPFYFKYPFILTQFVFGVPIVLISFASGYGKRLDECFF